MPNLLESLLVLTSEVSLANIAKLAEIISTILRLSVPVSVRAIGRFANLSLPRLRRLLWQSALSHTKCKKIVVYSHYTFIFP